MPYKQIIKSSCINCCMIICFGICLYSCNSIKPVTQNNLLQPLSTAELSKFNGDYEIISSDTSYPTLARALTFTNKNMLMNLNRTEELSRKEVRLNIKSVGDRRLKISVYSSNKIIKTKTLKGKVSENYFHFKLTKISPIIPFVLSLGKKQQNRIGLTKSGDLLLDSYEGGILFLIVMPTFGGDTDSYNSIFKRKKSNQ